MKFITRQEEYVLLTVHQLKENAYLVEIQKRLNKLTGKKWSISSVYVPLEKLEQAGCLKTRIGEPTARRGGRAIKYYSLTETGLQALADVKKVHDTLWNDIPDQALIEKQTVSEGRQSRPLRDRSISIWTFSNVPFN